MKATIDSGHAVRPRPRRRDRGVVMTALFLPLVGFAIALFVVAIGGGGGVLYVGVLSSWLHVAPDVAAATSLATLLPTTIMGAYSHWREGNVNVPLGRPMLIAGMFGALAGSLLSDRLSPAVYRRLLAAVLVYALVQMIRSMLRKRRQRRLAATATAPVVDTPARASLWAASIYGLLGGILSGLTGLSGSAPIVAGLLALGCSPLEVAGTSLFALTGLSAVGFAVHLGLGHVDGRLALLLCVGTLTGSAIGPRLLRHIPKPKLEAVIGPLLMLIILAMTISLIVH